MVLDILLKRIFEELIALYLCVFGLFLAEVPKLFTHKKIANKSQKCLLRLVSALSLYLFFRTR